MAHKGVVLWLALALAIGGIFFPSESQLTITPRSWLGFDALWKGAEAQHSTPNLLVEADERRPQVYEAYGKLPLFFEANRGQTDPQVKFLSRGGHHVFFLTPTEAVLVLTTPRETPKDVFRERDRSQRLRDDRTPTVLRMVFAGATPELRIDGLEELPGKANYFIGNDPAKWQTNVPMYARVHYHDLYPGIDLTYYGNQRHLEYDFVVKPGADPNRIMLGFQGADRMEVDTQGDLVLHTAAGPIHQRKPVIYQEASGIRKEIAGGYVLTDKQLVSFRVASYDVSQPLIIDPVLFYSTYLGGSGNDVGSGIAVDTAGNAYVTGFTASTNFPTTAGAFQTTFAGGGDAFVAKLNPTGSALVYSTYLGGSNPEPAGPVPATSGGSGIAVDALGNAYVTGTTLSTNFPTTPGAFQPTNTNCCGNPNAFVTKLDPTGSALVYSTNLGNSAVTGGAGIAVDAAGNAYVTGQTTGPFPTTPGAFQTTSRAPGHGDAFVAKLNPTGSALVYSTLLGGSGGNVGDGGHHIAVDAAGSAYVTGHTTSADFPTTPGAFQPTFTTCCGATDAFVTKLDPTGSALVYSTHLAPNFGQGIAVDALGNAYVTGSTGPGFPTTPGAFQTTSGGVFVTKLNPTGSALVYSTRFGGSGSDVGNGIAVDVAGNAYVTGQTSSPNFPTVNPIQASLNGPSDAFVTKVNPLGTGLVYSTYLGGSGNEAGQGIALDSLPNPNAYVTGFTGSLNFPTTSGAFQTTYGGGTSDAFVAKIANIVLPPGASSGKVTGGGTINVSGGIANFGFIVQAQLASGQISGDLQYVNHASGAKVHSVMFLTFTISGNTATFSGACTNNGAPCTFSVLAQDNGKTGENDVFTISIDGGAPEGGTLRSGKIQIHQCPCQ